MSEMSLPPLAPTARRGDQVLESLRAAILGGELEPGTRLRIRDVAEQLGTSVMPVRDAMTRLAEAGLVESIPYKGAVVKAFSADEMLAVYDVRRLLEAEAACRGGGAADPRVIAEMRSQARSARAAAAAGDQAAFLEHDEGVLTALYRAAGNAVLLESIQSLWRRCRSFKLFGARGDWASEPWMYQDDLLAAVEARDGERAASVIEDSIDRATAAIRGELEAP